MHKMMFYRNCIKALEVYKKEIAKPLSLHNNELWFEKMKNNKHCEWGQICMSLEEAKKQYQKLCDEAEIELKDMV